jgi:hypothetical protein
LTDGFTFVNVRLGADLNLFQEFLGATMMLLPFLFGIAFRFLAWKDTQPV